MNLLTFIFFSVTFFYLPVWSSPSEALPPSRLSLSLLSSTVSPLCLFNPVSCSSVLISRLFLHLSVPPRGHADGHQGAVVSCMEDCRSGAKWPLNGSQTHAGFIDALVWCQLAHIAMCVRECVSEGEWHWLLCWWNRIVPHLSESFSAQTVQRDETETGGKRMMILVHWASAFQKQALKKNTGGALKCKSSCFVLLNSSYGSSDASCCNSLQTLHRFPPIPLWLCMCNLKCFEQIPLSPSL